MTNEILFKQANKLITKPDMYKILRYLESHRTVEIAIKDIVEQVYTKRRTLDKLSGQYTFTYKKIDRKRAERIIEIFEWMLIIDVDYRDKPKKYFYLNERGMVLCGLIKELEERGER
ncbi:hypothetical protein ACTWQB_17175 [Piscibacillus sp. B03]|uniref:hypothetical protein n=1 Tax=Piscibacillus sp. B03 TaxID=3457430 RepID=UPI003FCEC25C